jgi:3-oxoacyl-[acyl-carrier-protein] synthase-1
LNVLGAGMVTSVGATALASCAAIRAKLAGFEEIPYSDLRNIAIVGAPIRFIRSESKGLVRLEDLAAPALAECASFIPREDLSRTALFIGLADTSRPRLYRDSDEVLRRIQRKTGLTFSSQSRVIEAGSLSTIMALHMARALFDTGQAKWCIVGGVDTYLERGQLRWLERVQRLKRPNNPDGVIPGEGACFVALGAETSGRSPVRLVGLGLQRGAQDASASAVPRATDLSVAMTQSLADAAITSKDVAVEITDMTGERDMGVDHAIAVTRTFVESRPRLHYWHPAMSVGTIGAAALPCAMALTWAAATRHFAPGPYAMCVALAETAGKGAAILSIDV